MKKLLLASSFFPLLACGSSATVHMATSNDSYSFTDATTLAPVPAALWDFGSVLGKNGQIYMAGGETAPTNYGGYLGSGQSEVLSFNPASDVWNTPSAPPSLPNGVDYAPLATAGDGRIYALAVGSGYSVGYCTNTIDSCASRIVFALAPGDSAWTQVASMQVARTRFAASQGGDGRIYVFGGNDQNGSVLSSVEVYDPTTDTWAVLDGAPMLTPRYGAAAALVPTNGKIYVLGGNTGGNLGSPSTVVEAFDPTTQTWDGIPHSAMPTARVDFGAAVGSDGRLYVAGNNVVDFYKCDCTAAAIQSCADATTAAYDPLAEQWTPTANLNHGRAGSSLVAGPDGRLYVIDGYGAYYPSTGLCQGPLSSVEVYTPGVDAWVD
jgi:hypothetical protein